jgi:hypothetical protein
MRDPRFDAIAANAALSKSELLSLHGEGFIVIPRPVDEAHLAALPEAYDSAVALADRTDVKEGSTTTRVKDFVNRGTRFDGLYLHPPLLHACCSIIRQPFRLSTIPARTLRPGKYPRSFTWTSQAPPAGGRWWASSSWLTSSGPGTEPLASCLVLKGIPTFRPCSNPPCPRAARPVP